MGIELSNVPELRLKRWHQLGRDLRALPPAQAGKLLLRKASKGWRARQAAALASRHIAVLEADLAGLLGATEGLAALLDAKFARLDGFPILPRQIADVGNALREHFPEWVARCVKHAGRICQNSISVLGHKIRLEEPPNWHKDHLSGTVWPVLPSARLVDIPLNQGADIKLVWELSRFHHGVTLGRAFALTADERYAEKFVSLFSDWQAANPPGVGPNWICPMEAAIRATNLLWAGSLVASSKAFGPSAREAFVKTLLAHGEFIYHHLEYTERVVGGRLQPVNGNHYLSDLAGLLHLSIAFPEYRHAAEWRDFATREFFREIRAQVDEEGVHAEYSPGYHRLVLEMVLGCLILLERQAMPVPQEIRDKALAMADFIRHYLKPSGAVPLVRDIDNGRFCILGEEELTTHDHLLALAAIYFDKPHLYSGELFEDSLWYLGRAAYDWHLRTLARSAPCATEESRRDHSPQSKLYRQSGFAVMRHKSHYLLALCCPKGMHGYCGHTHNDFLSFDLEAYGRTFLTDCGSYVYTQDPAWRNRFRSTVSHNTIMVDRQEQNRFSPSQLFEIDARVRPEILHWTSNEARDVLLGAYTLVLPDGDRVTHERHFIFLKDQPLWLIRDRLTGEGRHSIETRFHFAEGIDVAPAGDPGPLSSRSLHDLVSQLAKVGAPLGGLGRVHCIYRTMCAPGPNLFVIVLGEPPLAAFIESGWVSRSYAAKAEIRVLRFEATVHLPYERFYLLAPVQSDAALNHCRIEDIESLFR